MTPLIVWSPSVSRSSNLDQILFVIHVEIFSVDWDILLRYFVEIFWKQWTEIFCWDILLRYSGLRYFAEIFYTRDISNWDISNWDILSWDISNWDIFSPLEIFQTEIFWTEIFMLKYLVLRYLDWDIFIRTRRVGLKLADMVWANYPCLNEFLTVPDSKIPKYIRSP